MAGAGGVSCYIVQQHAVALVQLLTKATGIIPANTHKTMNTKTFAKQANRTIFEPVVAMPLDFVDGTVSQEPETCVLRETKSRPKYLGICKSRTPRGHDGDIDSDNRHVSDMFYAMETKVSGYHEGMYSINRKRGPRSDRSNPGPVCPLGRPVSQYLGCLVSPRMLKGRREHDFKKIKKIPLQEQIASLRAIQNRGRAGTA